ncbi:AMP-dependent synthetase/ligase [Bradyrhizobium liaoningense]
MRNFPALWKLNVSRDAPCLAGDTIHGMFWNGVAARSGQPLMRQKELGIWRTWTWRETGDLVRELTLGFVDLGLQPGECVSVLSNTRVEWVWCDLAILSAGGVSNGIYPTDSASQVQYLCEDSSTVMLVVEDEEQLDKALEARTHLSRLRKIVVVDPTGLARFSDPMVLTLDEVRQLGRILDHICPLLFAQRCNARIPSDLAILVYTSGTTGKPKGAMHSHQGLLAVVRGQNEIMPQDASDERVCFLPLCHIAERVVGLYGALFTGTRMNFVENPDTVAENVREIAPTVLTGVPRMWEKFYSAVTLAIRDSGPVQQAMYRWAIAVGHEVTDQILAGRPISILLRAKYWLAGWLALENVRRFIGIHRCRFLMTGAAPIAPDLIRWYLALGTPMLEAWGQTESGGISTCVRPTALRLGSIGRACHYNEVRIDPTTGELLVRGSNVFMGYLNQPERTAEAIDSDGWLHTGDVGTMDPEGFLRISDRMKDIIITAGGKNITPSEWENELKFSPYVTDAVMIGDRRSHLTAIVMIEQENVEKYAQDLGIPFSSYASLTKAPEIVSLIQREVDRANSKFARAEQVKTFHLLDTQLSAEDDELTPTMKLKRGLVQNRYARQIEAMYAQ